MGKFEGAAASCGVQLDPVAQVLLQHVDRLLVEAKDEVVALLPEEAIRHALWSAGGSDEGRQPGGFVERLFALCAVADEGNLDALLLAFPDEVMAWILAREVGGVELLEHRLRQVEAAREAERVVLASVFGLPFVPKGVAAAADVAELTMEGENDA